MRIRVQDKKGNDLCSFMVNGFAEIKDNKLHLVKWYVPGVGSHSPTTSKHINYVAQQLNLEIA